MRVLRVNEPRCPRCGHGLRSGYPYPSCSRPPEGMEWEEAHRVFCTNFAPDVCTRCVPEMRRDDALDAS